jgi:RNA polymerase sigma-70 factor (ECF subfamily)
MRLIGNWGMRMTKDDAADLMAQWRQGDQQAAAALFQRYSGRLIELVRRRLSNRLHQRVDPEDVIQSAYRSFFAHARDGHYHSQHGEDLWRLLVAITLHKMHDQAKWHSRAKRAVQREQGFGSEDSLLGLAPEVLAREPVPEEALELVDEVEQAMRRLDPLQRQILELRLQGHNLQQIATASQRCERTVRRVLKQIKAQLEQWYVERSAP